MYCDEYTCTILYIQGYTKYMYVLADVNDIFCELKNSHKHSVHLAYTQTPFASVISISEQSKI